MMPASRIALIAVCPGTLTGRWGRIPWSLPKAMFEPQKEIEPTTIENRIGINVCSSK